MSAARNAEELAELVGLLCDERIDDEQFARLETLLGESAAARRMYHALTATHLRLAQLDAREFADRAGAVAMSDPLEQVGSARRLLRVGRAGVLATMDFVRRKPVVSACTALGVLGVIIGSLALLPASSPPVVQSVPYQAPQHVARVVNLADAKWDNPRDAWLRETLLFPGDALELRRGLVEIQHRSGAVVVLEGPARYVVDDHNTGSLSSGKLLARVSPAAVGFTVSTPLAKITDLGTEFGVVVDDNGETHAHVFTGQIELAPRETTAKPAPAKVLLRAGEGLVVNELGQQQRVTQGVAPRFVRRLPSPDSADDAEQSLSLLQYRPRLQASARADLSATIGTLFAVGDEPLELTHLGVQDVDAAADNQDPDGADNRTGFADDDGFHRSPISVGLWNAADGRLLASAQVTSEHPQIGSWRYAELTGERVVLAPNERYVIGAYVGAGIEWFLDGGTSDSAPPFTNNLRIQLLENRYTPRAFAMPRLNGPGQLGRWGPANAMFQLAKVPETKPPH